MAAAAPPPAAAAAAEEGAILHEFTLPILLADKILKLAQEAVSLRQECVDLAKQVDKIYRMLQATVRLITTTTQPLYERPIRRIVADVSKNLERACNFVSKCRHGGFLRQVFSMTTIADFRKVSSLLESSIGDMKWLLSIFDSDGTVGLPPIASNDPTLAYIWPNIATIQMGSVRNRVEAANQLTLHTRGNERNKKIVVEEGGVPPLLKLLKEYSSPDAQIAAANVLINVASIPERVESIVNNPGVPIIVQVLNDSSMRVQIIVAKLVSKMAELSHVAQEEFARENVTKPLVTCLSIDMVLDDPKLQLGKPSFHSVVEINKELAGKISLNSSSSSSHSDGSSRGANQRKEKEVESSEVKLQLKVNCAEALWRLSKGSLTNSRKITETKGLLCLAKIIENEEGELQYNSLMTVMEVTAVAESKPDFRHAAFKITSPAPKAVLDQLSRMIQNDNDPMLQVPAIKSIGSLARIFPAKESRIINLLVLQMKNIDMDVAIEAVIALGKFACPENYNCIEHSKSIIGFGGVPPLMKLLRQNDQAQVPGLVLLCYLALSAGNSKALEQAHALNAMKGMARLAFAHPDLHDLYAKAIHHLTLYQAGAHHIHRHSFSP
ncbi:ARM REPEAT PROTEIN INTERACTING WITH ABF2-like [Benincasa hispida]|uniref:ARM REPEAT PROTEIN INTERACTING WITH ABF2-like n=1 Tax=Benincasa hispida TaxID=102211 RepID=UPI0018FF372B|nr:ARM REPEAT PROTEIN INTERACTING WITH ABF2-like [Benincasa hispida]